MWRRSRKNFLPYIVTLPLDLKYSMHDPDDIGPSHAVGGVRLLYTLKSSIDRASLLQGKDTHSSDCIGQSEVSKEELTRFIKPMISLLYQMKKVADSDPK
jgi:hypothetical protein